MSRTTQEIIDAVKAKREVPQFIPESPSADASRVIAMINEMAPLLVKSPVMYVGAHYCPGWSEPFRPALVAGFFDRHNCSPDPNRPHATANFFILASEFGEDERVLRHTILTRAKQAIIDLSEFVDGDTDDVENA